MMLVAMKRPHTHIHAVAMLSQLYAQGHTRREKCLKPKFPKIFNQFQIIRRELDFIIYELS